jgi:hypothetical protein
MFCPVFLMEKELGKIKKNDTTDIVVRVDDFGGKKGLTIREFVKSERYTGFTKSGVRILPENFSKFKEMIDSLSEKDFEGAESQKIERGEKAPRGQKTLGGSKEKENLDEMEDLEDY